MQQPHLHVITLSSQECYPGSPMTFQEVEHDMVWCHTLHSKSMPPMVRQKLFIVVLAITKIISSRHMPEHGIAKAHLGIQIIHHYPDVLFRKPLLNCV